MSTRYLCLAKSHERQRARERDETEQEREGKREREEIMRWCHLRRRGGGDGAVWCDVLDAIPFRMASGGLVEWDSTRTSNRHGTTNGTPRDMKSRRLSISKHHWPGLIGRNRDRHPKHRDSDFTSSPCTCRCSLKPPYLPAAHEIRISRHRWGAPEALPTTSLVSDASVSGVSAADPVWFDGLWQIILRSGVGSML